MTADNMDQDNQSQPDNHLADAQSEIIQAQKIAGLLKAHANHLSMRTLKQLENGREQAVKTHMQQTKTINSDGTINHMADWAEHHRVATTGMLVAAIIAGFVLMQVFNQNIEHGDAFLLGAELPPEAFVDTAFEPSLNRKQAKI
ncbi:MAG: DUF3619 family protein [Pseudomonadota bacterium]